MFLENTLIWDYVSSQLALGKLENITDPNYILVFLANPTAAESMLKGFMRLSGDELQKLYNHYLHFDKIDVRSFDRLGLMASDAIINYQTHNLVHYMAKYTNLFYYEFSQVYRFSGFYFPGNLPYGKDFESPKI